MSVPVPARARLLFVGILVASLAGCAGAPAMNDAQRRGDVIGDVFEFSSGGNNRGGQGEWIVRLRGDDMWIANDRHNKAKEYGSFRLTRDEYKKMWRLVRVAKIPELVDSTRDGGPRETLYMFSLTFTHGTSHSASIWRDDVHSDERLSLLTKYMEKLIFKYTDRKPQL